MKKNEHSYMLFFSVEATLSEGYLAVNINNHKNVQKKSDNEELLQIKVD